MLTHERIVAAAMKAAKEYPITKFSYFGSYADGRATEESDLDVPVEFTTPAFSILKQISLKLFLEEELGKPVDVIHAPIPEGSLIEIGRIVEVI